MARTDVSALAIAALLAAGSAAGAWAQATTEGGQTDQAQADQAQTDPAQADQAQGDATQAEDAAEPMTDEAATGTDAQAGATAGGEPAGGETTPEQDADVTVVEEAPVEADAEPADDATVVTGGGEDEADTVIVTEPDASEEADAVPVEGDVVVAEEAEVVRPVEGQIFEQSADQVLGSTLLDATVVSAGDETIGDVENMVVSSDGQITGVVIGVGGFLGIGQKEVAVEFDQIEIRQQEGGELRFVLDATREQLEASPEFQTRDDLEALAPAVEGGAAVQTDPNAVAVEPAEPAETIIKPAD